MNNIGRINRQLSCRREDWSNAGIPLVNRDGATGAVFKTNMKITQGRRIDLLGGHIEIAR